tara:strand:- start:160 stop:486 length:327 start_codon:yes stop_codon:yes gene_type:complete
MTFKDYQIQAGKMAIYKPEDALIYTLLSLSAEAGELAGKYSKVIRDHNWILTPEIKQNMALELGDVQWNVAQCATALGYGLEQIAQMNLIKLNSRMARGVLGGSGDNR